MALIQEFTFQDVVIQMLGKPVTGARGAKYTEKQAVTNIYGAGKKPVSRSYGKKEYDGELKILQSELEALQSTLPRGRSILDIAEFDVVVSYADASGKLITDILKHCKFMEVSKELDVDSEFMEVTLPLSIGDIEYNV